MNIFFIVIPLVILQRLGELAYAKRNAAKMFAKGAEEIDRSGYKYVVLMHVLFFMSVILEFFLLKRNPVDYWYIGIAVFGFAQMLRYWAIITLGERWNTRIIILKGDMLIQGGPYKYLRHPNYAAVAIEMAVLPLVFSCYLTSITFTVLNFIVLRRRIKIENHALGYTNK